MGSRRVQNVAFLVPGGSGDRFGGQQVAKIASRGSKEPKRVLKVTQNGSPKGHKKDPEGNQNRSIFYANFVSNLVFKLYTFGVSKRSKID